MRESDFARHVVDRAIERSWEIYWRAVADAELAFKYLPLGQRYPAGKTDRAMWVGGNIWVGP